MPELPEVEIVRRALEPVMAGQRVERVVLNRPDLRFAFHEHFTEILSGAVCLQARRRGKYMILDFDNDYSVIWHLGMSGQVTILGVGEVYVARKHDHVIWAMSGGAHIIYNDARRFGFMTLERSELIEQDGALAKMGPEPLGNEFCGPVLFDALRRRSGPIKTVLLDQRVVSGLGNIYVCEALFGAGLSPFMAARDITPAQADTLAVEIENVLNAALLAGGSSLKDYKHTDGSLGYFQHQFKVYGREGEACHYCGDGAECIDRVVQAGRSTFYCVNTQKT